jgi:uncharacterized protein
MSTSSDIVRTDMTWEIVGHSVASAKYSTAKEFQEKVLIPFSQRFKPYMPFRPVNIRGFYVDEDTLIVIWDGAGTTIVDTTYENTYAWIMALENAQVVNALPSTTASPSTNCGRSIAKVHERLHLPVRKLAKDLSVRCPLTDSVVVTPSLIKKLR